MSKLYRVSYRIADHVPASDQPARTGAVKVTATSSAQAPANARPIINVMRGRQFKDEDVLIENVELVDEATATPAKRR